MRDFQKILDEKLKSTFIEANTDEEPVIEYDIFGEIREEIIQTRKSRQISQKELAEKSGISQSNISKIENGHNIPSIPVLKRIADGLGKRLSVTFVDVEEDF